MVFTHQRRKITSKPCLSIFDVISIFFVKGTRLLFFPDSMATHNSENPNLPESLKMVEAHTSLPAKKSQKVRNNEKVSFDTSSTDQVVMETNIWKFFPEELFESVIARLPIAAIFCVRTVCRKWNSLPDSHSFVQHFLEIEQRCPWFYMHPGFLYDPSLKKWHNRSIPYPLNGCIRVAASAGGLVCLGDHDKKLYVCNPLTLSFKKLPSPQFAGSVDFKYVGMTVNGNSTSNGYKILGVRSIHGDFEVYDSVKNSWIQHGNIPASLELSDWSKPVAIESTLYFIRRDTDGIVSYNLESDVWQQFVIPLPVFLTYQCFTEFQGDIMLVGLVRDSAYEEVRIRIWELDKMTASWNDVDMMPYRNCSKFYRRKYVSVECLGNHGLVLLALKSGMMHRLVSYDVASGTWEVCPKPPVCILQRGRKLEWIADGITFDPSMTALP